jgi:hypothetical protein
MFRRSILARRMAGRNPGPDVVPFVMQRFEGYEPMLLLFPHSPLDQSLGANAPD